MNKKTISEIVGLIKFVKAMRNQPNPNKKAKKYEYQNIKPSEPRLIWNSKTQGTYYASNELDSRSAIQKHYTENLRKYQGSL